MSIQLHIPDHVLYEDDYILVLNKPAGLMVEPDRNGHPNLLYQVRKYLKAKLTDTGEVYAQHIHRLDRPVSGVILFTKQRSVLKNLSEQFAQRNVKKYYQALTTHIPQQREGILQHWHRKEKKKAAIADEEFPYAERISLSYSTEQLSENKVLWNIELHTGKYHQIRAQLAYVGFPIIGDALYGSTIPFKPDAIALHASKLIFRHPETDEVLECSSADVLRNGV
ncbi:RluA family pseudouridine synthase [Ohtaekwangia sp.]|uniref:RluA family pseudouridine synthase n=1 Tax=Ohtaekwangia sp. TaxID=2066019 RepID=UPI002FDD8646